LLGEPSRIEEAESTKKKHEPLGCYALSLCTTNV
jgi:hypothetical protein